MRIGICKEYIDGRFLAGSCGNRQRQVVDGADRADVVFTDTPDNVQHASPSIIIIVFI